MSQTDDTNLDEERRQGGGGDGRARGGIAGFVGLLLLISIPLPVVTPVFLVVGITAVIRKVRTIPMLLWTAAATLLALAIVGFNPFALLTSYANGWLGIGGGLLGQIINTAAGIVGIDPPVTVHPLTIGQALAAQLPLSLPIGFAAATLLAIWAGVRRQTLGGIEGEKFDTSRPFGIIDWARRRRSARRITTGKEIRRPKTPRTDAAEKSSQRGPLALGSITTTLRATDTVALGTGKYGHPVRMPTQDFRGATFVFGVIRSGKTAVACSIMSQAATGGAVIIDFKGDQGAGSPAEYWGRFALAMNRKYKHFSLARKSGATYQPPVVGLPELPACFDPLRHGNADSKTTMLQHSVDRTGNAAIYLQQAADFTMIAYQVAAIVGLDKNRSGFQTLHDLCSIEDLERALQRREGGRPFFDPSNPTHATVMKRAQEIIATGTRDPLIRGAISNTRLLLSTFMNGAAAGPWLRRGSTADNDIDLYDAVVNGHIVVFSLPVQDYKVLATTIGNLALLDMNNVISSLRERSERRKADGEQPAMDWEPFVLQVEEFGSASPEAMMDILNKSGDVECRVVLSSQTWNDLTSASGDAVARKMLDQAANVLTFKANDESGPNVLSNATGSEEKFYPATSVDESMRGGIYDYIWKRFQLRLGGGTDIGHKGRPERQLRPTDIQKLAKPRRRHNNTDPASERIFECIWIAMSEGKRLTHTVPARANQWVEVISTVIADPEAAAKQYPNEIYPDVDDYDLEVADAEVRRATTAAAHGAVEDVAVPDKDRIVAPPLTEPPVDDSDYDPNTDAADPDQDALPAEPPAAPATRPNPEPVVEQAPSPAPAETPAASPVAPAPAAPGHLPAEHPWAPRPHRPANAAKAAQEPQPPNEIAGAPMNGWSGLQLNRNPGDTPAPPEQPAKSPAAEPTANGASSADAERDARPSPQTRKAGRRPTASTRHAKAVRNRPAKSAPDGAKSTAPIESTKTRDTTRPVSSKSVTKEQNENSASVLDDPFA